MCWGSDLCRQNDDERNTFDSGDAGGGADGGPGAGGGRDGRADDGADGEGGTDGGRRRLDPVYGDVERLRLSGADVQEPPAATGLPQAGEEREEDAAPGQGGAPDADRDGGVPGDAAYEEGEGGAHEARRGGHREGI